MKTTDLRQLIKESIQEYIKEIDEAGNRAALEAKMAKTQEAIDLRKKKLNMEGLDEAYHDMMDKGKMKEMTSEIKLLEKSMGKYKKMLEKMDAKDTPKMEEMQDDKVEEEIIDETNLDEYTADSASELEEAKMTKAEKAKKEDIVKGMKKSKSFGKSKEEKAKMYATATKLAMKESEVLNESFLHMQKLAGLITETQYKQKLKEASFEYEDDELTLAYNNAPKTLPWDAIEKAYQESGLSGEEFFAGYETEFRKQFEGKPVSKEAYFKFYEDRATGGQDDRYAMFNWISFSNPEDSKLVRRLSDMI